MKPDSSPQYIIDAQGNRVSVVLPVDDYQELLDDLEDLAAVAERRMKNPFPMTMCLST